MSIDGRISELVRDALRPMLAEQLELLEERLAERITAVVQSQVMAPTAPILLTLQEVAERLRVAPRTVQRMVAAGRLPAPVTISPGRSRWLRSSIDAFLEGQEEVV